jgi:hypothetical protein
LIITHQLCTKQPDESSREKGHSTSRTFFFFFFFFHFFFIMALSGAINHFQVATFTRQSNSPLYSLTTIKIHFSFYSKAHCSSWAACAGITPTQLLKSRVSVV